MFPVTGLPVYPLQSVCYGAVSVVTCSTDSINQLNKTNVEVWIRQVIIPEVNDNEKYINDLANFIKNNIKNVTKIDFLPYHKLGDNKYQDLGIKNPYINKKEMDKDKCNALYNKFLEIYKKSN